MQTYEKFQKLSLALLGDRSGNIAYASPGKSSAGYWALRVMAEIECAVKVSQANGGEYDGAIDEAVSYLSGFYDSNGAVTKEAAVCAEDKIRPVSAAAKGYTMHCVAHAHIDMNWMWGFPETAAITMDSFRTMLDLMNEYKDFTFSQSQASTYRIVEQYDPEMLDEIKKRVKEGRWEIAASTWVEADKNMPNGESFARHVLYTKRYMRKIFGIDMDDLSLDYEPDTFGHNWNVPEICNKGGVKYYYHHRAYDGHYVYRWQSRSGAEVIVFRDPKGYNATVSNEHLPFSVQFCNDSGIKDMLYVYGVGDHGGGPTRRDIERLIDMSSWPVAPKIEFSTYGRFYAALEKVRDRLPVVNQELNFVFTGCYTSQSRIKMSNRISEDRMYDAEALSAASKLIAGGKDDTESYSGAWEKILFNHFHDILTGSGVIHTREYALGEFQKVMATAGTNANNAMRRIAASIDTSDIEADDDKLTISEGAGVGYGLGFMVKEPELHRFPQTERGRGKTRIFHIFNPTEFDRRGAETIIVWDWDYDLKLLTVKDGAGNDVKFQILYRDKNLDYWGHQRLAILVDACVPAFGYATYVVSEGKPADIIKYGYLKMVQDYYTDADKVLENESVRAVFKSGDMRLVSFVDKKTGKDMVCGCRPSCGFRFITEDTVPGMTSWRVGRYAKITDLNAESKVVVYEENRGEMRQVIKYRIAFERSTLDVSVSLDAGSGTLHFNIDADWHEIGDSNFMPQLSFYAPFAFEASKYRYDIPFGTIDRDPIDDDTPGNSFIAAIPDDAGVKPLMLVTDTKYGYRGVGNSLSVNLIRSSTQPDPSPEDGMHNIRVGLAIVESACDADIFKASSAFVHPLNFVSGKVRNGALPKTAGLMKIDGGAKCSAVKYAEDGDGLIVRLYDIGGGGRVNVEFFKPARRALIVDLTESKVLGEAAVDGRKVGFDLPAHEIATLKVIF